VKDWYQFAIAEIDKQNRHHPEYTVKSLNSVRQVVDTGRDLSSTQETFLMDLYKRSTEIRRIVR
jgi:hypothetical protein